MNIDISFQLWQKLTAWLADENDTYDSVITRLIEADRPTGLGRRSAEVFTEFSESNGAAFKGVFLPDGTELRASYKGKTYFARISGSSWIDSESGEVRTSPSQAAYMITGSGANGWLFWLVKRPQDQQWHSLNELRGTAT